MILCVDHWVIFSLLSGLYVNYVICAIDNVYTSVYTCHEVKTMLITKAFLSGNSQAVRIPKECRLPEGELCISKIGSALIIFPSADRLSVLMESLSEFTDDFMSDGRPGQTTQDERVVLE